MNDYGVCVRTSLKSNRVITIAGNFYPIKRTLSLCLVILKEHDHINLVMVYWLTRKLFFHQLFTQQSLGGGGGGVFFGRQHKIIENLAGIMEGF